MLKFFKAAICLLVFTSCVNTKTVSVENVPQHFVPASHLVFIGLDGWGGAYTAKADMPTVKKMMAAGAHSLDVRCDMPSNSWPNWPALFYSYQVGDEIPQNIPSIFSLVKKSVLFYEWSEFEKMFPYNDMEKIEISSDIESAHLIAEYIKKEKPVFTAVIFNELDSVGHKHRWGSAPYYSKLTELDSLIAIIQQAVKDAGIYDDTVFVLSSDHGGTFWGHGYNIAKQRKIPLVVYGKGIKKGSIIPSPAGIRDITPIMAAALGIEIPQVWTGQLLRGIFE